MDPQLGTFLKYPTKEEVASEYVHGEVIRQSPLLNQLDPQTLNGVKYHLGDHATFRSGNQEFRGRIISFYRNGGQDGPVFAEMRPLKTVSGALIAASSLTDIPVTDLVSKEDIVAVR